MFDEAPPPIARDVVDAAVNDLHQRTPENSALGVLSPPQKLIFLTLLLTVAFTTTVFPIATFIALNAAFTAYFIIASLYRMLLMALGARRAHPTREAKPVPLSELPVITILAPLYKDAEALASLSNAIDALEYPESKKDVKLLLEEDDRETLAEARKLSLHDRYDVIVVPDVGPRTKPKACNVGLRLACGELVVIYDAEDQPETDQLMKAARAFVKADKQLACLQARLNYYNARDNWLTRGIMAQTPREVNPVRPYILGYADRHWKPLRLKGSQGQTRRPRWRDYPAQEKAGLGGGPATPHRRHAGAVRSQG